MEDLLFRFDPGTHTCKSPLPERFEQIVKIPTKEEFCIKLHGQEDLVDVDGQLDRTLNLMVCNIIQRTISQLIGRTLTGFVTLKGTDAGALHVYLAGSDPASPAEVRLLAGTNLIGKVQIDGHSQTILKAKINIATAATHDIIAAVAGKSHHITSIMFTVAGEVNVTLRDETGTFTGAMDFGGTNEPRGMTHNHELSPLICTAAEKFQITLSAAIQVSGYVTYYDA